MVVFGPPLCNIDTGLGEQSSPHLLQEDSRVVVPQIGYKCGNTQKDWEPKPTIYFYTTSNHPGVKLSDVIRGNFKEMKDRDEFPFGAECRGITIRMHVGSCGQREPTVTHLLCSFRGTNPALMSRGN